MKKYIYLISLVGFISFSSSSQAQSVTNPILIKTLETYIKKQGANPKETRYQIAEIDLNGDKKKDTLVLFLKFLLFENPSLLAQLKLKTGAILLSMCQVVVVKLKMLF